MSSFSFLSAEHHLTIVDRKSTTFRSSHLFNIRANVASRFFVREYNWSGSGVEREKPPEVISEIDKWGIPHQRMHGPLLMEGNARTMVVDLGRTVDVGQDVKVDFRHQMRDLAKTFKPFFLFKPSTQIQDSLTIRLTVPNWKGFRCNFSIFDKTEDAVVETETAHFEEDDSGNFFIEKHVVKPSHAGFGHLLRWSHDDH